MPDVDRIRDLETLKELKGCTFELAGDGPEPGAAYAHQRSGLDRIERGAMLAPPVSGILHYPTGAGKTRVGMELIARALRQNPKHRFVWATHTTNLIRQSMVRMAELSRLFPRGTRFIWADAADAKDAEEDCHVVFMTRRALAVALDKAGDRRVRHAWSQHLQGGHPMTLIYDECHQLGAEGLQKSLRKFYDNCVTNNWRVIGLSATPVPTRHEAHDLLQERVFPRRSDTTSTSHGWPFHVFQRIQNEALVKQGILCRINTYLDKQGGFDLPADLLWTVIGDARLKAPGAAADDMVFQKYALQFNSKVMADPRVVEFLADRIGRSVGVLGKTIVFVPNIDAANRMAGVLYERFPALRGKVAAVHSKMRELRVPGQDEASVHEVLDRFRRLGDEPSILVNVDMLTEGFDDPKVLTVVLARLTLSTNRFWQMIGRGTRGPATRPAGTDVCNVIDPVKLTRLYNYFSGYEPTFADDTELEFEDLEERGGGQDAVSPLVPQVIRPPDPSKGGYVIDPELARLHAQVAHALRHFLEGEQLSEAEAVDVSRAAAVTLADGHAVLKASNGTFDADTATAVLLGEISSLERRAGIDLAWFRQKIPVAMTESLLRQQMRMLRAIDAMGLSTESAFAEAQMRRDFLEAMQHAASGAPPASVAPPVPIDPRPVDGPQQFVLDALLAVAGADGSVSEVEVGVIMDTLRRMFGVASTTALEATVRARAVPAAVPVDRLATALSTGQQQLLLMSMVEVAAADAIVTPEERAMLHGFASTVRMPVDVVDSILGGQLARADVQARASQPAQTRQCPSCGSATPAAGAFCTGCGARVGGAS